MGYGFSLKQVQPRICLSATGRRRAVNAGSHTSLWHLKRHGVPPHLEQHEGKVIVIDNYDSFTYNLSQYLGSLACEHAVLKNDELTVAELQSLQPKAILLSPGPGRPEDSGISLQTVQELGPILPIFGVCMGHQCIGQVFGGKIVRAPSGVMHGKSSPVYHRNLGTLKRLSNPFNAARYHSLVIEKGTCPESLEVIAWTEDGTIMAVQHRDFPHVQARLYSLRFLNPDDKFQIESKRLVIQGLQKALHPLLYGKSP